MSYVPNVKIIMSVAAGIVGAETKHLGFADQTQHPIQKQSIGNTLTKEGKRWNIKT